MPDGRRTTEAEDCAQAVQCLLDTLPEESARKFAAECAYYVAAFWRDELTIEPHTIVSILDGFNLLLRMAQTGTALSPDDTTNAANFFWVTATEIEHPIWNRNPQLAEFWIQEFGPPVAEEPQPSRHYRVFTEESAFAARNSTRSTGKFIRKQYESPWRDVADRPEIGPADMRRIRAAVLAAQAGQACFIFEAHEAAGQASRCVARAWAYHNGTTETEIGSTEEYARQLEHLLSSDGYPQR